MLEYMPGGAVYTRISKAVLVWAVAFFVSLVVFNNLTDYDANYQFVAHVLRMGTVFEHNRDSWRAIDAPFLYHTVYSFIILVETVVAVLCWLGGLYLFRSINDIARFHKAKKLAIIGLTLGILLWFTGFIAIGGEWFLKWQSQEWNGQQAAFRLVVMLGVTLMYLAQPDGGDDA